jgi:hypothetical protein
MHDRGLDARTATVRCPCRRRDKGLQPLRASSVFGGAGNDIIATGSSDDIVFGDLGRVDYTKKITVDGVEYDAVVTRLGHSVPQNPVNPHVTFATDNTISDSGSWARHSSFRPTTKGLSASVCR